MARMKQGGATAQGAYSGAQTRIVDTQGVRDSENDMGGRLRTRGTGAANGEICVR